jgi:hypothetical protein
MAILDKLLGRNTMTDTPTKIVVNCETGVAEELPLTPEEIAQREADAIAFAQDQAAREAAEAAAAEAKASAQAKLAALGLTADEIAALSK